MTPDDGGKIIIGEMPDENPAANLVRGKLKAIYGEEPSAKEELREITESGTHSKHQKYMAELIASGKSQVDIQTAWHEYYQNLSDLEKHEVWQEFYEQHSRVDQLEKEELQEIAAKPEKRQHRPRPMSAEVRARTMADLHSKVIEKVSAGGKLKAKHHVKSLAFSLAFASLVTGILFFITNNEKFIAPFVTPSKTLAAAPLITDGSTVGPETKVVIPKINLEANVVIEDFDVSSDAATWDILEKGVVLYPYTGVPGEKDRNPVFFGHSSNNIFNHGVAKFIFVRLHELQVGDTYAINYGGKQYVYKIFARYVVNPNQVEYLYQQPSQLGKVAMSTLITCDPPGTAYKRLILQGEQISPDPSANVAATTATEAPAKAKEVPSNSPSLLKRLFGL
jgi:LPXTG-site transpeptidase (sortase) family protein